MSETRLVFKDAGSDKFWNARLDENALVTTWGKTGTAGQSQTKQYATRTDAAIAFEKACAGKLAKGYVEEGAAANLPAGARKTSLPAMRPQLCDQIKMGSFMPFAEDDHWRVSQKLDGQRVMIHVEGGQMKVIGRDGQESQHQGLLSMSGYADLNRLPDCVLDGELMPNGTVFVFDLITDLSQPYAERRDELEALFDTWRPNPTAFSLLREERSHVAKLKFVKECIAGHKEGVILRDVNARYQPGKRSKGVLKCKFTRTIDCVVTDLQRDGKANIVISAYDDGDLVELGEVTALAGDGPNVKIGDVVEVTYLYALPGSTRLVQPTLPKIRTDKQPHECTTEQLHFTNKEVLL